MVQQEKAHLFRHEMTGVQIDHRHDFRQHNRKQLSMRTTHFNV